MKQLLLWVHGRKDGIAKLVDTYMEEMGGGGGGRAKCDPGAGAGAETGDDDAKDLPREVGEEAKDMEGDAVAAPDSSSSSGMDIVVGDNIHLVITKTFLKKCILGCAERVKSGASVHWMLQSGAVEKYAIDQVNLSFFQNASISNHQHVMCVEYTGKC